MMNALRRGRNRSSNASGSGIPSIVSQTADPRFAVQQDEDLVYTTAAATTNAAAALPFGNAPGGTMKIRQVGTVCPGFAPATTCIRLEYDIPAGTQQQNLHPHPGVPYPGTTRFAYLPNNDAGCRLLTRFKVAWNYGHMFKIGKSLTSGLDDQVCWTTIPNKTSVHGGPFGFPDSHYIAKANAELDKLGIPSEDQCLALLTSSTPAVPAVVPLRPPAQNPAFVAAPSGFSLAPAHSNAASAGVPVPSAFAFASAPPAFASAPPAHNPMFAAPAAAAPLPWGSGAPPDGLQTVAYECIPYKAPKSLAIAMTPDLFETVTGEDDCAICLEKVCKEKSVKIKGCQHEFHFACLQDSLKHNPRCPTCRKPLDCARGKSPSGTMTIEATDDDCPGYGPNVKSIRITYSIPSGVQKDYHENPNQRFSGTTRVAYLPNTVEGQKVLRRFKYAWKHGLTFRVGRSLTTGISNQVTWTSIHHKTSLWGGAHGFPDNSYLDNVNGSLDALHVPDDPTD